MEFKYKKLSSDEILKIANDVFEIEIDGLKKVKSNLSENFVEAINLILESKGKVVLTGMGKSGIIANKIAATLSSTGTLAVFLHPAEGLHGDLGMVAHGDVIIILGKSGESDEVTGMLPSLRRIGCKIIGITANLESTLAKNSDVVLDARIDKEACALNLAPTTSTTAALVMGDALATALTIIRDFKEDNYALYHPGGRLGKRLVYKVSDFMYSIEDTATCSESDGFREVLIKMSEKNLGACIVVSDDGNLKGIVADGDIKRILTKYDKVSDLVAKDIMTPTPKHVDEDIMAYDALVKMQDNSITVLPVVRDNKAVGLLRMHDLLNAGLR